MTIGMSRQACKQRNRRALRRVKATEAETLLRQALAVFQELKLEHEIKKAEELLARCTRSL